MKTKLLLTLLCGVTLGVSAQRILPPIYTPTTEELVAELSQYRATLQVFVQDDNNDLRIITSVELRVLPPPNNGEAERNIIVIH